MIPTQHTQPMLVMQPDSDADGLGPEDYTRGSGIPRLTFLSSRTSAQLLAAAISPAQQGGLPLQVEQLPRGAISPISWVPNETLQEIFILCLPRNSRFLQDSAPLILGQVCILWRSVAAATPSLWSSYSFWTPPLSNTDLLCYPLYRIDRWISRSRNATLSLTFERDLTYIHLKIFTELILLGHYSECRHLAIHLRNESAFALIHFVKLPPASLSHLESLVLEGLDEADFSRQGRRPMITVFRESPKLHSLMTSGLEFCFSLENSRVPKFDLKVLPWPQLRRLVITDFVRVEIFAIILAECAAIQFLRVSLDLDAGRPFDVEKWRATQSVTLLNLTDLHISVLGGSHFPYMLDTFQFPALETLYFRRTQDITSRTPSDFFSWEDSYAFTDQLYSLRELSLVGRVGSTKQVCILLHKTPKLAKLSLDIWTDFSKIIPLLFPLPDPINHRSDLILPFLEDLRLHLGRQDFPFPSCFITSAAQRSVFLSTFSAYCSPGFRTSLKELRRSFLSCRLVTEFALIDSGSTRRRLNEDQHLIHCVHPNDAFDVI